LKQQLVDVHRAPRLPHAGPSTPVASTVSQRLSTAISKRQPEKVVPVRPSVDPPLQAQRPRSQSCPQSCRQVVKKQEEPACEEPEAESSLTDNSEMQQRRQQQQHFGPQLLTEQRVLQQHHQPPPPAPSEVPEPTRLPSAFQRHDFGQEGVSQADVLGGPASTASLTVSCDAHNAGVESNSKLMVHHFQRVAGEDVSQLGFQVEFAHESGEATVLHVEEGSWAHGAGVTEGDNLVSVQGSQTSAMSRADVTACLRGVRPLVLVFGRRTMEAAAAGAAAAAAAQPPVHDEREAGGGREPVMWARACPHSAPASVAVVVNQEPFCFSTGHRDEMPSENGNPLVGYEEPLLLGIFPEYGFREVSAQPQLDLIEASYAFPELVAWCKGESSGSWHVEAAEVSKDSQPHSEGLPVSFWFCNKTSPSTRSSPSCQTRRVVPGESIELLTMEEATEACSFLRQRSALDT